MGSGILTLCASAQKSLPPQACETFDHRAFVGIRTRRPCEQLKAKRGHSMERSLQGHPLSPELRRALHPPPPRPARQRYRFLLLFLPLSPPPPTSCPSPTIAAADTCWGLAKSWMLCSAFPGPVISSDAHKSPGRSVWTCVIFPSPAPRLHLHASWYHSHLPSGNSWPIPHSSGSTALVASASCQGD